MLKSKISIIISVVVCSLVVASSLHIASAKDMKTEDQLDEILYLLEYEVIPRLYPGGVLKTGQTNCYEGKNIVDCEGTGQDGEFRYGIGVSGARYTDNLDGTVTDELTGLMWTQNANLPNEQLAYPDARAYVEDMNNGVHENFGYTDWRIPNLREFFSKVNFGYLIPPLIPGHPFVDVQTALSTTSWPWAYWTSTIYEGNPAHFWGVDMRSGTLFLLNKGLPDRRHWVWPVRGGRRD